jgi:S1-C subfamily serine protease
MPRGFLGVELVDIDKGVQVKSVLARSAAADAGLQPGDRVTHFQGKAVQKSADLMPLAARLAAGEEARIKIMRGESGKEIIVKMGKGL